MVHAQFADGYLIVAIFWRWQIISEHCGLVWTLQDIYCHFLVQTSNTDDICLSSFENDITWRHLGYIAQISCFFFFSITRSFFLSGFPHFRPACAAQCTHEIQEEQSVAMSSSTRRNRRYLAELMEGMRNAQTRVVGTSQRRSQFGDSERDQMANEITQLFRTHTLQPMGRESFEGLVLCSYKYPDTQNDDDGYHVIFVCERNGATHQFFTIITAALRYEHPLPVYYLPPPPPTMTVIAPAWIKAPELFEAKVAQETAAAIRLRQ